MRRDEVLQKLKTAQAHLRAQGVAHAAVFGSVARGEDRPDSDIEADSSRFQSASLKFS